jgi:hypothetical protein
VSRAPLLLLVALGCRSGSHKSQPPLPEVKVEIDCDDQTRQQAVTGDLELDDQLCGKPWSALQIEAGPRIELLRPVAGRQVWLRRAPDRAFIEVRTPGSPITTIDHVTSIEWRGPPSTQNATIEIATEAGTQNVTFRQLQQRVGSDEPGEGRQLSLCRLADTYGDHPATIAVYGELPQAVTFTHDQCASRGLVVKLGGTGDVRLRATSDGERILRAVHRIVLARSVTDR